MYISNYMSDKFNENNASMNNASSFSSSLSMTEQNKYFVDPIAEDDEEEKQMSMADYENLMGEYKESMRRTESFQVGKSQNYDNTIKQT